MAGPGASSDNCGPSMRRASRPRDGSPSAARSALTSEPALPLAQHFCSQVGSERLVGQPEAPARDEAAGELVEPASTAATAGEAGVRRRVAGTPPGRPGQARDGQRAARSHCPKREWRPSVRGSGYAGRDPRLGACCMADRGGRGGAGLSEHVCGAQSGVSRSPARTVPSQRTSARSPPRCTSGRRMPPPLRRSRWAHGSHRRRPRQRTSPSMNSWPTSALRSVPRTTTLRRWSTSRPSVSRTAASTSVSALPGRPEANVPAPAA
jgi:hypothetical protein